MKYTYLIYIYKICVFYYIYNYLARELRPRTYVVCIPTLIGHSFNPCPDHQNTVLKNINNRSYIMLYTQNVRFSLQQ